MPGKFATGPAPNCPPIVAVVGRSNSGKTTVASSLISALAGLGYRIAAIKHCPHGHDLDRLGSDTYRLRLAGAAVVVASSPDRITTTEQVDRDTALESVVASVATDVDLVIAEGFKSAGVPKVLVSPDAKHPPPVDNVIAVVGDPAGLHGVPSFDRDSIPPLAELLRERCLASRSSAPSVTLSVDGVEVPLDRRTSRSVLRVLDGLAPGGGRENIQVRVDSGAGSTG